MVLGHEGVFSRGGPEQRAVHKECGDGAVKSGDTSPINNREEKNGFLDSTTRGSKLLLNQN